jgi:hypothetical protein
MERQGTIWARSAFFFPRDVVAALNHGEGKMKGLLIAGMIALGGVAVAGAPAQAASVVISTGGGYHHPHYRYYRHHWRHHHRHCWVKVRRTWHHGHRVVRRVRICD